MDDNTEQESLTVFKYNELDENAQRVALDWAKDECVLHIDIGDDIKETINSLTSYYGIKETGSSWSVGDRSEHIAFSGELNIDEFIASESSIPEDDIIKSEAWCEAMSAAIMLRDHGLQVRFKNDRSYSWATTEVCAECDLDQINFDELEHIPEHASARTLLAYQEMNLEAIFEAFAKEVNHHLLIAANETYNEVYEDDYAIDWMSNQETEFFACGTEVDEDHDKYNCNECDRRRPPTDYEGNPIVVGSQVEYVDDEDNDGTVGTIVSIDKGKNHQLIIDWSDGSESRNTTPDEMRIIGSARERLASMAAC